jgi:hypothetical protein
MSLVMPAMFADFDPGTLTGFYAFCLTGICVIFCVIGAGVSRLMQSNKAAARWMLAAGVCLVLGLIVAVSAISFGKRLGLL